MRSSERFGHGLRMGHASRETSSRTRGYFCSSTGVPIASKRRATRPTSTVVLVVTLAAGKAATTTVDALLLSRHA
ncbi:hypothetical protein ACX80S_11925 [Arthrobacter sp. RHLT1-20]